MKHEVENGWIKYSVEEEEIIIEDIKVFETRKGTGSELIDFVKEIAEKEDLSITLYSYPQDDTIEQDDLNEFYFDNGFELDKEDVDNRLMIWK